MTKKALTDVDGNTLVTLPVSKLELTFRPAKGKDLIAIEKGIKANDTESNLEASLIIASQLVIKPEGMSTEDFQELDAMDMMEVSKVVSNFPFIRSLNGLG